MFILKEKDRFNFQPNYRQYNIRSIFKINIDYDLKYQMTKVLPLKLFLVYNSLKKEKK